MKKLLLASVATLALAASSASAADLRAKPVYKAPPPVAAPVPLFNWSGFYIGVHGGGAWVHEDAGRFSDFLEAGTLTGSGGFGGGQIGYNWVAAPNIVLGIEADVSGSGLSATTLVFCPFSGCPEIVRFEDKMKAFGTARARLGYAVNNILFYGTGGFAWLDDEFSQTEVAGGKFAPPVGFVVTHSATRLGWTGGGGIEWGFSPGWSVKVEYLYMRFGDEHFNWVSPVGPTGVPCSGANQCVTEGHISMNTVRIGLNYRFGFGKGKGPVVARY